MTALPLVLDLFSGTGSATRNRSWSAGSTGRFLEFDINPKCRPDIVADVRHLPLGDAPLQFIWAGPPASRGFSVARDSAPLERAPTPRHGQDGRSRSGKPPSGSSPSTPRPGTSWRTRAGVMRRYALGYTEQVSRLVRTGRPSRSRRTYGTTSRFGSRCLVFHTPRRVAYRHDP